MTNKITNAIGKLKKNVEKNEELINYIIIKHENFKIKLLSMLIEKYDYKHHSLENKAGFTVRFDEIYTNQRRADDYYAMKNIVVDIYCEPLQNNKVVRDKYYIITFDFLKDLIEVDDEFTFIGFTAPHGFSGHIRLYYQFKDGE